MELQRQGRLDEAEAIYQSILETQPDNIDALQLQGLIERTRNNYQRAHDLLHRALDLKPNSAILHHNYAGVCIALGDLKEAERHYRAAIQLQPDYAEAFYNLSRTVHFERNDPTFPALDKLLQRHDLSKEDRCFGHFAMGKMLDDIHEYRHAFPHFQRGNLSKGAQFDLKQHQMRLQHTLSVYTREFLEKFSGCGNESVKPIFMVGMPRTGSTLIEQILSSHPQVHGIGEVDFITPFISQIPLQQMRLRITAKKQRSETKDTLTPEMIKQFSDQYLSKINEYSATATRIVDKQLLNFKYLGLIALMFPNAKIIHCRRHPLDTCLSCYFQNFVNGQEYSFDLEILANYYSDYMRLMNHWRNVLPIKMLEVHYESLVEHQAEVSRRMIEFCDLTWDEQCMQFYNLNRPVSTASQWQIRQPIYHTAVSRWKHYAEELAPLRAKLDFIVQGYEKAQH